MRHLAVLLQVLELGGIREERQDSERTRPQVTDSGETAGPDRETMDIFEGTVQIQQARDQPGDLRYAHRVADLAGLRLEREALRQRRLQTALQILLVLVVERVSWRRPLVRASRRSDQTSLGEAPMGDLPQPVVWAVELCPFGAGAEVGTMMDDVGARFPQGMGRRARGRQPRSPPQPGRRTRDVVLTGRRSRSDLHREGRTVRSRLTTWLGLCHR